MSKAEGLLKTERICSKVEGDAVFASGKRYRTAGLSCLFLLNDLTNPPACKVLFSVPKKKLRLAVHRNRIKRLMRDIYRKNKSELTALLEQKNKQLWLIFIFSENKLFTRDELEKSMLKTIEKVNEYVKQTK